MTTIGPLDALGTVWYFEFFDEDITLPSENWIAGELEDFEAKYSRFRSDSWLSCLNRDRVFKEPDAEFVRLLEQSLNYYKITQGFFNIGLGEIVESLGYDADYSFVANETISIESDLSSQLSITTQEITLKSGKLDLGGIGKGFLIDKLSRIFIEQFKLKEFLINGGGDIYATTKDGKPILINLAHPLDTNLVIGEVPLFNQGFAGSSPFLRSWIDPKTKIKHNHLNTDKSISSFVVSDSATSADVMATTLCLVPDLVIPGIKTLLLDGENVLLRDAIFNLYTV